MAPTRRTTRTTRGRPAATTPPTGNATNSPAVSQAMLDQLVNDRVAAALAAANANNSTTDVGTLGPTNNNKQGCTYKEFRKTMAGGFGGTEGAVVLVRWIERLETVF